MTHERFRAPSPPARRGTGGVRRNEVRIFWWGDRRTRQRGCGDAAPCAGIRTGPPGGGPDHPRGGLRGPHRDRARDARDHHPLLVLVGHLRVRRLLVRAVRAGRRDGRTVLGPSRARAPPAVGGALHVRGLRRRPPSGRRGAAERPLPRRHPPERRDPGPSRLRRGREHPHLPRGACPLGGRRRHGAGELLGALDQHLPGGGADPADQDPGAGEGQPRRHDPAHGQHAGPRGA